MDKDLASAISSEVASGVACQTEDTDDNDLSSPLLLWSLEVDDNEDDILLLELLLLMPLQMKCWR